MNEIEASDVEQKKAVSHLDTTLAKYIRWVAAILLASFSFLALEEAPIKSITEAFDANSFTKFGLFLLFAAWATGATDDTRIQTTAYTRDPKAGKIGIQELVGILLFIPIFTGLFLLHEQLFWFQLALLVFICVNMWTYSVVVMDRASTIIEASKVHSLKNKDYKAYMKLYCAVEYLTGNWQRKRFMALFFLALIQLLIAGALKYLGVPEAISQRSFKGVDGVTLASYLPSVLFVVYVLTSEIWIRVYRYKIFSDFETIDAVAEHFKMAKQRNVDLPSIDTTNLFRRSISPNRNYRGGRD